MTHPEHSTSNHTSKALKSLNRNSSSYRKMRRRATLGNRTHHTASPHSKCPKRTPQKRGSLSTPDVLPNSPAETSTPSQIYNNASKKQQTWFYSANSMSDGDIIISASAKETNGKQRSRPV